MQQPIAVMNYDPYSPPAPVDPAKVLDPGKMVGRYMLTGERVDESCMVVWARLKALRAVRPQLSEAAIIKRIIIWREWCRHWNSYAATATAVGMYYRRGRSRQHIYNVMRRMREAGILTGLPG